MTQAASCQSILSVRLSDYYQHDHAPAPHFLTAGISLELEVLPIQARKLCVVVQGGKGAKEHGRLVTDTDLMSDCCVKIVVEILSVRSRESVSASSNKAKDNKITVAAAEESEEKTESKAVNLKASQISQIDGVKNPDEVDNDRITKTARYYFQPAYKQS